MVVWVIMVTEAAAAAAAGSRGVVDGGGGYVKGARRLRVVVWVKVVGGV